MLKRFNPNPVKELPVCQIEINKLKVTSNHSDDLEGLSRHGYSLDNARNLVKNNSLNNPIMLKINNNSGSESISLEEAEELIVGLQSMVDYLKS